MTLPRSRSCWSRESLSATFVSPLAGALLLIAAGSEAFTVTLRGARVSGSFAALVLAMALLGPVPAAAIGVATALFDNVLARHRWRTVIASAAMYAVLPLLGGALLYGVDHERPDLVRGRRRAGLHGHERAELLGGRRLLAPERRSRRA